MPHPPRLSIALLAGCGVLVTSATSFADSLANGVEVGFRSGYSLPFGNLSAYEGMGALFDGVVPIWVDAGYRTPHLYVGAFFQYGLVLVSGDPVNGCSATNVTCTGSDVIAGIDLQAHLFPDGRFDPWAGVGAGYEWANVSSSTSNTSGPSSVAPSATSNASINGWQLVNLQLGLDFKDPVVMPGLGIGPFVMLSVGQYTSASGANNNTTFISGTLPSQALHEWLTIGVRGAYDIHLGGS
jgi:hypothetical protein